MPRAAAPTQWDNRARRDERSLGHAATKEWDQTSYRPFGSGDDNGGCSRADADGAAHNSYRHGGDRGHTCQHPDERNH